MFNMQTRAIIFVRNGDQGYPRDYLKNSFLRAHLVTCHVKEKLHITMREREKSSVFKI